MRPDQWRCQVAELPPPPEGIVLAHFIVSDDIERSRRFYTEVLGGRVVFSGPGGLTYVALSNCWIIINVGGGPTDDKPAVTLETPRDPGRVSSFLNIRVKDIEAVHGEAEDGQGNDGDKDKGDDPGHRDRSAFRSSWVRAQRKRSRRAAIHAAPTGWSSRSSGMSSQAAM